MVRRMGYILAMLFICVSMRGEDSTFVFRVSPETDFFYISYKDNQATADALAKMVGHNATKISDGDMALNISGNENAVNSVRSYFIIYEGLREKDFVFDAANNEEPTDAGDYLVTITFFLTDREPEVIRRKRYRSLSKSDELAQKLHIPGTSDMLIHKSIPWAEQFSPTEKPILAIKTNLLSDVAATPNIEFDLPIAKHWSIAAEFSYGWWLRRDNSFCWQLEYGGLELRYWINPHHDDFNRMSRWYVGAFYNLGIYDFQFDKSQGTQGDFNTYAGVSGGYIKDVNRHIRFEFSFGFGYMSTTYQKYYTFENVIVKSGSPILLNTIVPKAKISLMYIVYKEIKKGGSR